MNSELDLTVYSDRKKFYNRVAWLDIRRKRLNIDKNRCQKCWNKTPRQLTISNLHVHHIEPVWENPKRALDIDNLITLCSKCHTEEEGLQHRVYDYSPYKHDVKLVRVISENEADGLKHIEPMLLKNDVVVSYERLQAAINIQTINGIKLIRSLINELISKAIYTNVTTVYFITKEQYKSKINFKDMGYTVFDIEVKQSVIVEKSKFKERY